MPTPQISLNCGGTSAAPSQMGALGVAAGWGAGISGILGTFAQFAFGGPQIEVQAFIKGFNLYAFANPNAVQVAGAGYAVGIVIVAVTTAVIISYYAGDTYSKLSSDPPKGGTYGCVAGVVETVVNAESKLFNMHHGRVDVVVKSMYWDVLTRGNPPFLWCAGCANCSASVASAAPANRIWCSPMLRCYYRSNAVVGAALGAAIGATAGAILGAVLGSIAAIALAGACGCGVTVVFAPFCLLVVLLLTILAVVIVCLCALIGGAVGSEVGRAAADKGPLPAIDDSPGSKPGTHVAIQPGAYVSVFGYLVQTVDALGANALQYVGWVPGESTDGQQKFADISKVTSNAVSGTTLFGNSMNTAPFCFTDPDEALAFQEDPCIAATVAVNAALGPTPKFQ